MSNAEPEPDAVNDWLRSLFAKPDDTADDTTAPPSAPGVVPAEGGNPSPRGSGDDVRQFTRGLFGHTD